jgi:hypothetical protein
MNRKARSRRSVRAVERKMMGRKNADRLEAERDALLRRLDNLDPRSKRAPGYASALKLLNQKFRLAALPARLAILQAADFMIGVLERLPFA